MMWACVGTNMVAKKMVKHLGDRVVIVWSRSQAKLDQFVDETKVFGAKKTIDLEDVLRSEATIVYINTPNHMHEEFILRCLSAKKHVLCEKSLCVSNEQALRISAAVRVRKTNICFIMSFSLVVLLNNKCYKHKTTDVGFFLCGRSDAFVASHSSPFA
jgi:predicted dehydrogenase